jgi:sulfur carrier protein
VPATNANDQGAATAAGSAIAIRVNDRDRSVRAGLVLAELLADLGLDGRLGLAVAVNGKVVPRREWPVRALAAADEVLLIQASQGG